MLLWLTIGLKMSSALLLLNSENRNHPVWGIKSDNINLDSVIFKVFFNTAGFWFYKYKIKYTIYNSLLTVGVSSWFLCPLLLSDCSFSHFVMVPAPILNNIYKLNQELDYKVTVISQTQSQNRKRTNWRSISAICRWLNFEGEMLYNCTKHLLSWLEEL